MWVAGTPCCKLYVGGKYVLKGPPPKEVTMPMQDVFESEQACEQWAQELVAWQNNAG